MKRKIIFWICFLAFLGGFYVWWIGEKGREIVNPFKEIRTPFKTKWKAEDIFTLPNQIKVPFPKGIVTEAKGGDTFILSTGQKVRLVGITLEPTDSQWGKEARELAKRLVERREIFLEYEPSYKKDGDQQYVYLYFRIPIIPSQPPVGPEYVHWSLNAELLRLGYARVNESIPFRYLEKFRAYEKEARGERKGLWKTP